MIILGINAYHADAAACLVKDGKLVAAAEEERFRRIKHWAGFPSEAIKYCLQEGGVELRDVDHVAVNRDPRANFARKVLYTLAKRPSLRLLRDRARNAVRWGTIESELARSIANSVFRGRVHPVEHHLAHMASAFLVSPYSDACVVSVDGFGDFASAAWGAGHGNEIAIDAKTYFPHSLGIFYQAMTQYLGFPHYGDEYKVMGLSAYGEPRFQNQMRDILQLQADGTFRLNLKLFRHPKERVDYEWENRAPKVGTLYSHELEEILGPARQPGDALSQDHKNLARSVQLHYEEAFFGLLNALYKRHRIDALCLAGGCAYNSAANGKIYQNTRFTNAYIHSAGGDAGGAVGAAFALWYELSGAARGFVMDHAFFGPSFSSQEIEKLLASRSSELSKHGCNVERITHEHELCRRTALAIHKAKVVGWFQGRMEWGPRALGNRSILCDPRRADMKDILNLKIKRRETFRPFAPSILREAVSDWFETDDDVPFMMKVFQIREDKQKRIPAVAHVDGSGRLQTVEKSTNPLYYKLIETFGGMTNTPIVLNTSFNEHEPVVCRPEEALDCFLRTEMDVLVLGDHFVERQVAS